MQRTINSKISKLNFVVAVVSLLANIIQYIMRYQKLKSLRKIQKDSSYLFPYRELTKLLQLF